MQIKLATAYKFPFLATGGGHGYGTTFGLLQNGLELDLGHFKTVEVDAEANTLTIGGSVTFAEIMDPLYNAGKQIRKSFIPTYGPGHVHSAYALPQRLALVLAWAWSVPPLVLVSVATKVFTA